MKRPRLGHRLLLVPVALLLGALLPAAAQAESRTYNNLQGFGPSEEGGTVGPANNYPGSIVVAGVPGTVTKVTVTTLELTGGAGQLDMALVGPNGAQVMLLSDACNSTPASHAFYTFDDSAPEFVPAGCTNQPKSFKPTNNEDPDLDKLNVKGGPVGPFGNSLAAFNGISPNGTWNLFLIDDTPGSVGFTMSGWALNLEVAPPPPPPPTIITVQLPAPTPAATGKRAAALAKCKKKPTKKQKAQCRAKAVKLPV